MFNEMKRKCGKLDKVLGGDKRWERRRGKGKSELIATCQTHGTKTMMYSIV